MGEGPLQKYFLGEKMHGAGADIFTANMYLAEDRVRPISLHSNTPFSPLTQILCWELVSKRGGQWILHYVKSAYAETDVPDQVPELISQRRRWLNGSFFAAVHSTVKFNYIYRSSHTAARKFWIHVELVYQVFNLIFSWFGLANCYIAFVSGVFLFVGGGVFWWVLMRFRIVGHSFKHSRRSVLQSPWYPHREHHPQLLLSRLGRHVLHPRIG